MRIALLSLIGRIEDDTSAPVAGLGLAGTTIVERQLDLALSLGCERIICLMTAGEDPPASLENAVTSAGVKLSTITAPHGLLGLVGANDELLVIADGLVPAGTTAAATLSKGNGVLVFPVDAGISAGFERIDLNYAWAGILMMPANLVERLSQLPSDCDTVSTLLRIALQAQVPIRNLPESLLMRNRWALIESGQELAEFESEWLLHHLTSPSKFAPGLAVAGFVLRKLGPFVLNGRLRPQLPLAAGASCGLLGAVAAWFGQGAVAIAACGAGWLLIEVGRALGRIMQAGLMADTSSKRVFTSLAWFLDLCFLASLALLLSGKLPDRLFPPLVLLALLHLSAEIFGDKWGKFMQDRMILAGVLVAASIFGLLLPAIQLSSVVLLVALLRLVRGKLRLTRA